MLQDYLEGTISNIKPTKFDSILFLLPPVDEHSGGETSVIRLGTFLAQNGKTVYYSNYLNQDLGDMKKNMERALSGYKGQVITYQDALTKEFDFVVATFWKSVYKSIKIKGYKVYFVQDFEPYFYSLGEEYLMAMNTYNIGYKIISLGTWNKRQIIKNTPKINADDISVIEFPYQPGEFPFIQRDFNAYPNKKTITMAVYIKEDPKRVPLLLDWLLCGLNRRFEDKGIQLKVSYFGIDPNYNLKGGKNLGKLNRNQMSNLYSKSDFGMVASMTNISLVPLEMMSNGLPLIEFREGSFPDFFDEKCAILTDFNIDTLEENLINAINNPKMISEMVSSATNDIYELSWEKSAQEFMDILNGLVIK